MTENTPTHAELVEAARVAAKQYAGTHDPVVRQFAIAENRMADALEAVTAERDALAAVIEQAQDAAAWVAGDYDDAEANRASVQAILSTAPATVLAQVKADAVREVKQVIFDSLNGPGRARAHELGIAELIDSHAFRIEREAQ